MVLLNLSKKWTWSALKKWESSQMCSMSTAMDKHREKYFYKLQKSSVYLSVYLLYVQCVLIYWNQISRFRFSLSAFISELSQIYFRVLSPNRPYQEIKSDTLYINWIYARLCTFSKSFSLCLSMTVDNVCHPTGHWGDDPPNIGKHAILLISSIMIYYIQCDTFGRPLLIL